MSDVSISQSMLRNSILLGVFALVTALILAVTFNGTADLIAEAERLNAQRALLEIVPQERHNNDLLTDTIAIDSAYWQSLGLKKGGEVHIAKQDNQPVAIIIPAIAPDGYSGAIKMIIGINMDGRIAGVRILSHTETPGLGDKIDLNKSNWITMFDAKSLNKPSLNRWKVKKDGGDFDQLTGATITPRAVVHQVKRALEYFQANRQQFILAPVNTSATASETY
jgi:electron transport complex protein RnfG